MERLCYSLLGVKWKMCWGILWATSVGLRRPIAERQRETVRKLSPYDVFPPSRRRFRRDTRGSQESYDSVGVMKNRRKRVREQPTPRGKKERNGERRRVWGTLSLLLCVSSAYDIMLTEGTSREELNVWMNMRKLTAPLSINVTAYTFLTYLYHAVLLFLRRSGCLDNNNRPRPEFINMLISAHK